MNNYNKYIKYKTKYLKLKKKLNNTQFGGRKVKTISNGGKSFNIDLMNLPISRPKSFENFTNNRVILDSIWVSFKSMFPIMFVSSGNSSFILLVINRGI